MELIVSAQSANQGINSPMDFHAKQKLVDDRTVQHYESLSYFEREEALAWLKQNLSTIPILAKTKKTGLAELVSGEYRSPSALLLIRQAMQALGFRCLS